jgi:hypothetical protein
MNRVCVGAVYVLIILYFGITLGLARYCQAEDMCIPMGSILLEPPSEVDPTRSPVEFPHSRHFTFSCQTCHHDWKGETQIEGCMTSGCHDLEKSPKKNAKTANEPVVSAARYYKTAFHNLCRGCHQEIKNKNKKLESRLDIAKPELMKTGPTGCIECHPK